MKTSDCFWVIEVGSDRCYLHTEGSTREEALKEAVRLASIRPSFEFCIVSRVEGYRGETSVKAV